MISPDKANDTPKKAQTLRTIMSILSKSEVVEFLGFRYFLATRVEPQGPRPYAKYPNT
jgi:hypothetical protein